MVPEAPEGWEFVNPELVPKQVRTYLNSQDHFYRLLIQKKADKPATPTEPTKPETKQVTRKIILHLPDGDKVVAQTATATKKGKHWKIESFSAYQVPVIDGYSASVNEVPAKILTVEELDQPQVVEVNYQLIENKDNDDQGEEPETGKDKDEKPSEDRPTTGDQQDENIDQPAEGAEDQDKVTDDQEDVDKPDSDEKSDNNQPEEGDDQENGDQDDVKDNQEATDQVKPDEGSDNQPGKGEDQENSDQDNQDDVKDETVDQTKPGNDDSSTEPGAADQDKVNEGKDEPAGSPDKDQATSGDNTTNFPDTDEATDQAKPITPPVTEKHPSNLPNHKDEDQRPDVNKDNNTADRDNKIEQPSLPGKNDLDNKNKGQEGKPTDNNPGQLVDTNFTPSIKTDEADPLLGQKLAQLQAPLNQLEDEYNVNSQPALPQTGNEPDTVTTLLGLIITAWTALTSLFLIDKKLNKFK